MNKKGNRYCNLDTVLFLLYAMHLKLPWVLICEAVATYIDWLVKTSL